MQANTKPEPFVSPLARCCSNSSTWGIRWDSSEEARDICIRFAEIEAPGNNEMGLIQEKCYNVLSKMFISQDRTQFWVSKTLRREYHYRMTACGDLFP